jgi:hypothetical protein
MKVHRYGEKIPWGPGGPWSDDTPPGFSPPYRCVSSKVSRIHQNIARPFLERGEEAVPRKVYTFFPPHSLFLRRLYSLGRPVTPHPPPFLPPFTLSSTLHPFFHPSPFLPPFTLSSTLHPSSRCFIVFYQHGITDSTGQLNFPLDGGFCVILY